MPKTRAANPRKGIKKRSESIILEIARPEVIGALFSCTSFPSLIEVNKKPSLKQ
jgi:hypothetical protein